MHKTKVSIGLAVYNGEKYLEETLVSILDQSYTNFELIISDNASTDATQDICMTYAASDRRIHYFCNDRNKGVAPNYNQVFNLSSGKYFKWADYDDILEPEFLSKSICLLDENPNVVLCFPKTTFIDEFGNFICDYDPLPDTSSDMPQNRFHNLILFPHKAVQSMGLMRSNAIKKTKLHGSYPSSDEVFLAHMALLGHFSEIPDRLLHVRLHPGQSTEGVLGSHRTRSYFFDTSLVGSVVLVRISYLNGCLHAIRNSPLTRSQQTQCYLSMFRWITMKQNLRSVTKDILLATHERIPLFPKLYQGTLDAANKVVQ